MRNNICLLLALLFVSVSSIAENAPAKISSEDLIKSVMRVPMTRKNILFMCALGGATTDDLKAIGDDLNTEDVDQNIPTFEIKKNEIYINNQPSGLVYKNYSPVTIEANYRKWTYDSSKSTGDNYFAFRKFVKGLGQKSALNIPLNIFMAEAYAQTRGEAFMDTVKSGFWTGALSGGMIGGVATGVTTGGVLVPVGAAAGAVIGAPIGTVCGAVGGLLDAVLVGKNGVPKKALVDNILQNNFSLSCTPTQMTIVLGYEKPKVVVAATRLSLIDSRGRDATSSISIEQGRLLTYLQQHCANPTEAQKIIALMKTDAKKVIAAIEVGHGDKLLKSPGSAQ